MLIFFYGTTGESIKIATLVEAVPASKRILIDTNQQPQLLKKFYDATTFPRPNTTLSNGWRGKDLVKPWQMVIWLMRVNISFFFGGTFVRIWRIRKHENIAIIVHGDTVTTVVGAIFGRLLRIPVVHIEAGLRSGSWKHPFPEELDRRMVSKLARLHYAPGDIPYGALIAEKTKGEVINTGANTVADSAIWAQRQQPIDLPSLPKKFCLVSVHRNEFLVQTKQVEKFLQCLRDFAETTSVVFLDHPITARRLKDLHLDHYLDSPGIVRVPKQNYINMMHIIKDAAVVVTDSGGLQEESYYLGVPCIVFRDTTERTEGLGENVVLSGINAKQLKAELSSYKRKLRVKTSNKYIPTETIIADLKERLYI